MEYLIADVDRYITECIVDLDKNGISMTRTPSLALVAVNHYTDANADMVVLVIFRLSRIR